jgi:hypothetical protein
VRERLQHAFPAEAVERLKHHQIKLARRRGLHHGLKLRPVAGLAGAVVDVFMRDRPTLLQDVIPQLVQLVGVFLLVASRNAGIERYLHYFGSVVLAFHTHRPCFSAPSC